jgi:hypothetical protein
MEGGRVADRASLLLLIFDRSFIALFIAECADELQNFGIYTLALLKA